MPVCVRFIPADFAPPCPPITAIAPAFAAACKKSPNCANSLIKLPCGCPRITTSTTFPRNFATFLISLWISNMFAVVTSPSAPPAGGAEGDVTTANMFDIQSEIKNVAKFRGKVVLVVMRGQPQGSFIKLFAQFGDFLQAAAKAGAIAVIGGQGGAKSAGMNLTHTGILGFNADFAVPVVSMTAEDQGQLERYVDRGITPRVRFNIQNTFTNGPVESANVVGEIRGRENPEQVFVVGGHLDSWDLSEGTTDNGMGSSCVLGAADAIVRSGMKPRRTIRFVLFTGEEQGLDGSFAYVKQHEAEMANHLGDLVLDNGQGPVRSFQLGGRDDLVEAFWPFAKSLTDIRDVKVEDKVEDGTDTLPFSMAGLPGINMDQ